MVYYITRKFEFGHIFELTLKKSKVTASIPIFMVIRV